MKRISLFSLMLILAVGCFGEVKYIFYMIGDGMGPNQVLAAETYSAALEGRIGRNPLRMTSFPYTGFATTYSASNGITDSSAAGTALATGHKTNNGCLGVDKDSLPVMSIAEELHNAGWPVGIMTSVAIDHATPGAFYAHVNNRGMYYQVGTQLAETDYEFFGGAGFHEPVNDQDASAPNLYDYCEAHDYVIAHGYQEAQNMLVHASSIGQPVLTQTEELAVVAQGLAGLLILAVVEHMGMDVQFEVFIALDVLRMGEALIHVEPDAVDLPPGLFLHLGLEVHELLVRDVLVSWEHQNIFTERRE